jgi:NAD(P)-dependent dehydrogenase (short-subunit alcohol dehydrogenase family)
MIAIVTGGNTGIGKATARGLVESGATVIIACRDLEKGEAARRDIGADRVQVMPLDLADTRSIRRFASVFRDRFDRLDVLINNAGMWTRERTTTKDGFEATFGVNHLGPFLLTHLLRDLLIASAPARIVNVSSGLHYRGVMRWDDLQYERRRFRGPEVYAQSKLANVLYTAALADRLKDTGVTANALHPGVVATELAREYPRVLMRIASLFLLTPEEGARTSLYLALSPDVAGVSGRYFERSREKTPSRAARSVEDRERLWSLSEQMLGMRGSAAVAA